MSQYREQLARVRRFLTRIETHNRPLQDYDDDMWSFFQNCWHLKDWVKNDPSVPPAIRATLEVDLASWPDLMTCADLANGTKHLQLKTPRVGARHTQKNFRVVIGGDSSVEYVIETGDGTQSDAVQLARNCVTAWEQQLKKYGLPIDA